MANPNEVEQIAAAMIAQNADLDAIFAPWDVPAEQVVSALRAAGRDDVNVVTIDLGATNALDMAQDGNVYSMTSTLAFEFGYTWAIASAKCAIGEASPEMIIIPVFAVTKSNLAEGWEMTFKQKLPEDVAQALGG